MVLALQRAGGVGRCCAAGPLLLLAMANRKLFQTAEEPRLSAGRLAAANRSRDCPTAVGRVDGGHDGVETPRRRLGSRRRTKNRARPSQRPPNETPPTLHCPRAPRRTLVPV